jgi:hypothetical protein
MAAPSEASCERTQIRCWPYDSRTGWPPSAAWAVPTAGIRVGNISVAVMSPPCDPGQRGATKASELAERDKSATSGEARAEGRGPVRAPHPVGIPHGGRDPRESSPRSWPLPSARVPGQPLTRKGIEPRQTPFTVPSQDIRPCRDME